MKGGLAAAAVAAVAGSVHGALHGHGHGHLFARRSNATADVCLPECSTIYSVVLGPPTLVSGPPPKTTTAITTATTTTTVVTSVPAYHAPPAPKQPQKPQHPALTGVPVAPGVHTFQPSTVTITQATTICAAATAMGPITTPVGAGPAAQCSGATVYQPGTYLAPKQVITVTKTGYVYFCPLSTATPAPPAPEATSATPSTAHEAPSPSTYETPVSTPEAPVVTNEEIPAVTDKVVPSAPAYDQVPVPVRPKTPVSPPEYEVPTAPVPKKHEVPTAPAPKPAGPGKLTSDNDHFGITYTPYEPTNGKCKDAQEVDKDIAELKKTGFGTIRVYSTDCNTLENVGNACAKHQVHMIVGVFVKDKGCSYDAPAIKEQVDALAKWDKWGLVSLVVVGNEAIMNGHCTPRQLRDLVTTVKSKCPTYQGKYTISETLNIWQRPDVQSEICGVVDVTGANIHPFFNAGVTPDSAGQFVAGQLDLLAKICGHNEVINLECGWPTRGNCNGKACPGKTEQATAIKSIREKTGDKTVFFSFKDDAWKETGSCGCEQSWGVAASFATSY